MVFVAFAVFVVPIVWIHVQSGSAAELGGVQAAEVTIGIGVILRATARRLLRSASSNILRTTVGAFSRASARAVTRRQVKLASRILFGSLTKHADSDDGDRSDDEAGQSTALALALGCAALWASFFVILRLLPSADSQAVVGGGALSFGAAASLATLPLLAYAGLTLLAARIWNVKLGFQTAIDGVLLQGYFTGATSFLPMCTDVSHEGTQSAKLRLAVTVLGGLYVLHLTTAGLAAWLDSYGWSFLSSMFLLYSFVYTFPIPPLEGQHIWKTSKLMWAALWIPILISFVYGVPPEFSAIL